MKKLKYRLMRDRKLIDLAENNTNELDENFNILCEMIRRGRKCPYFIKYVNDNLERLLGPIYPIAKRGAHN